MADIYKITHIATGRCYVGHTSRTAKARMNTHRKELKAGIHANARLQNGWNKYGESAFSFEKIETCRETYKLVREQHYIDTLDSFYNIAKVAGSRKGVPQPPHVGEAVRRSHQEKKHEKPANFSEIMKEARKYYDSPGMTGQHHPQERIERIRASNKANTTRKHVGMKNKHHSDATKELMAAKKIGKKQSPEHVAARFAWRDDPTSASYQRYAQKRNAKALEAAITLAEFTIQTDPTFWPAYNAAVASLV